MTLCHWDSFNCRPNPFIVVASCRLFIVMLMSFIEDILILGGGLRDPPWVPLKSTNARVLCSYGAPHLISNTAYNLFSPVMMLYLEQRSVAGFRCGWFQVCLSCKGMSFRSVKDTMKAGLELYSIVS